MKLKYIAIAISLVSLTLVSCNRDEDSLFEKSASERAAEAVNNAMELLPAAENGWEMVYFPNKENMSTSKGYIMVLRFGKDGSVSATAKNSLTTSNQIKTDVSTWEVISDYGPILSFNTYNEVLHAWSDPQNDGDGYLGDYEFLILSANKDLIILKGKKHSAYSVLRPMKTDDMAAHFAACEKMQHNLFGNGNVLALMLDGTHYDLIGGENGMFYQVGHGEAVSVDAPHYAFAATTDGIILCYGFDEALRQYGTKTEHVFTLDGKKLQGENGTVLEAGELSEFVENYIRWWEHKWDISTTETNATTAAAADQVLKQLQSLSSKAKKNASVKGLTLRYDQTLATDSKFVVEMRYTLESKTKEMTPVKFAFDFAVANGKITLAYKEPADERAKTILQSVPTIEPLVQTLNGTYTVSADGFNPAIGTKLVSQDNAEMWFNMSGLAE